MICLKCSDFRLEMQVTAFLLWFLPLARRQRFCYTAIIRRTFGDESIHFYEKVGGLPMKKHEEGLFQIGEVAKILGVTRKAILVYENKGLLSPAFKDEKSGFRYYTADNMTQIRSIRSLQSLGLSLKEVADYYYDTENIDLHLQKLLNLRAILERNIQLLQVRSAKPGDLTVHRTALPWQVCFCRQYSCADTAEAAIRLRDTYIAAAKTGEMSMLGRMFTMRINQDPDILDIMCCIPMNDGFDAPERVEFPQTAALCVYYRGPYEGTGKAVRALLAYAQERHIQTTGPIRSIYLEGPPNRGENSADYITQVAVPVLEGQG